ncbi:hypothetical protein NEUTE1DRAFT_55334, partial [Neurospora tetrasperma FGSC 2508]
PIVQLTINSHINTSIGIFPFFITYGFNIEFPISIIKEGVYLGIPLLFSEKRVY